MGGCFSVSCDPVVNQVSQWLCLKGSYVYNFAENLASLEKAMGPLKAKRDGVQERVNREEFTGKRQRLAEVQVWFKSILNTEKEFNDLLSTSKRERERLCLCGFCSKKLRLSCHYGKRVVQMLKDVERLTSQGDFPVVTEPTPIAKVEELPIQPTIVGQETMLEKVWNRLMDDKVGIMGLYGMGGVGKTTLLTQINNKLSEIPGGFDIVIWVVVSQNATIHKIQGDIGKKLLEGKEWKEWEEKNEMERAVELHKVLRRKKFVLLLDDIWKEWDLSKIGVPYPDGKNKCKIAFTTRYLNVCGSMKVHDPIEVRCLDTEKSWDLFKKNVGEDTLRGHPDIPELARKVAGECRGLPLALNVIGKTMSSKTVVEEWRGALDVLTSYASKFSGMEDKILPTLKYSYDALNSEQMKSCFLYCSLFPEDSLIDKDELIEYWKGEGFIDEKVGRTKAYNQGHEIIGTLIRACLLLVERDNSSKVKMHDVVRDMALWIASDLGKHKERCIVQAGIGIREIPEVENWKNVRRMSLMKNEIGMISESHKCPELTTLLLQANSLKSISGEFFQFMPRLLVLDLSNNYDLRKLPEQISRLVSLRHLDMSGTYIELLPVGLQELKMLMYLNLNNTKKLESLLGISNLSSLRTLKLLYSNVWLDKSLVKELEQLEHLEIVNADISSSMVGEQWLHNSRVGRLMQCMRIVERPGETVRVVTLPAMDNLDEVVIRDCKMEEIKIKKIAWNKSPTKPCFSNLSVVKIVRSDGLKDLTWLLFAPNLSSLYVQTSNTIEEIISEEKAASILEKERCNIIPFERLVVLSLLQLPELKSIYWNALPFECLNELVLNSCPKLGKLPLDSKSVGKVEDLVIEYDDEEWMERVEWEDEATRHRFLPQTQVATCWRVWV